MFRPPFPLPLRVTVVSPPERIQTGDGAGCPVARTSRKMSACTRATTLVSPSILVDRISGR